MSVPGIELGNQKFNYTLKVEENEVEAVDPGKGEDREGRGVSISPTLLSLSPLLHHEKGVPRFILTGGRVQPRVVSTPLS